MPSSVPSSSVLMPQSAHTPSRERNPTYRSDMSFTASPNAPRTAPSSNPSAPTTGTPQSMGPVTVQALLSAHATASDPPMAALESAVSDRNTLSGQNSQLWKLIEKQRAAYTQLMKELERVRGERDAYKSRLQFVGENTDALLKAHRERERREGREGSLRSATSHTHLRHSESGGGSNGVHDPRHRMQSEDIAPLRQLNGADPASRPHTRERQGSQNSLNISVSTSQLSSQYLSASQASSSSHLALSPSDTGSAASSSNNLPIPTSDARRPLPLNLRPAPSSTVYEGTSSALLSGYQGSTLKTATTATDSSWNIPPSALPSTRPTQTLLTGLHTADTSFASLGHHSEHPRSTQPTKSPTPESPTKVSSGTQQNPQQQQMLGPQVIVQSASGPNSEAHLGHHDSSNSPSSFRPFGVDRGSRISLPEEARRYYANMTDSPAPSPRSPLDFPQAHTDSASPDKGPKLLTDNRSDSPPKQSQSASSELERTDTSTLAEERSGSRARTENSEFLDLEGDTDSNYDSVSNSGRVSTVDSFDPDEYEEPKDAENPRRKRATAEDFPLPPGSSPAHLGNDQFDQMQTQAQSAAARSTVSESADGSRAYHHEHGTADSHAAAPQSHPQPSMAQAPPPSPFSSGIPPKPAYRALRLLPQDLPRTTIQVSQSSIRPNDRGKDVLSFIIQVDPNNGKEPWKVEKLYSDVLTLDSRVRATIGKTIGKKLVSLPEGRLWKDHAPAKVDQRKAALEQYLRSLIALPAKNKDEVIAFFTSGIANEAQKPVTRVGYKEGYLTKRGKNFGGWKTRYFVLQGPSLEYYESRGGAHLGSIQITGAQIGRQQRTLERKEADEDNEYRHAFLIIEAKRGPGGSNPRHVLCAESDAERDNWVEVLVRYVSGRYSEDDLASVIDSRASTSSEATSDYPHTPTRRPGKIEVAKAMPLSQLAPDANNAKLFSAPVPEESPARSASLPPDTPLSSSLPSTSTLVGADEADAPFVGTRANSEMGHYADMADQRTATPGSKVKQAATSPDQRRKERRRSVNPLKPASIPERPSSPEKDPVLQTPRVDANGKVKISGPMNGTPIPAGYKFGGSSAPPDQQSTNERREKAKSRSFWGFGRMQHDKPNAPVHVPRAVFGVSLEESLDVAEIASLPAIVFRCIQYLEAKKADQEEGIYRLSGSSAVIKALKDRFNNEGDVDLLASDEHWDPHAIAGLLKSFLRELPASILTRELHLRFLSVIDFVDAQERISELSQLIAALPIANYSLLRALTAHLILIVQNAHVNKMTMRNVGIVFSPTLGIPAGVFSLMLGEFKRVFNVDGDLEEQPPEQSEDTERVAFSRRNSKRYSDAAADQMLGLSGRTLTAEEQSDEGEDLSVDDESGTEGAGDTETDSISIAESSATHNSAHAPQLSTDGPQLHVVDLSTNGPAPSTPRSKASAVAAGRGLSVSVTDKASRRQSRVMGLPTSPRPPHSTPSPNSPRTPQRVAASPGPSPLHTPK